MLRAQVNLSSGLTACYALDGNATEPVNNLNGTTSAVSPTVNRLGNATSALYFNGSTSSYVELPETPLLKPANALSFSCWIKTPTYIDQYILFTRNSLSAFFEAYELCIDPSLHFMTRKSGPTGMDMVVSTTPLTINTWFHLVITIDNSFVKLYVNGVLDGSTTSSFNGFDYVSGKKTYLGITNEGMYDMPFTGTMDNIRFYSRTISAADVSALYSQDPTCAATIKTGLNEKANASDLFQIMQNPVNDDLVLKSSIAGDVYYQIKDLNGKVIDSGILNDEKVINMAAYQSGMYFLHIPYQNPHVIKKIMKL